MITPDDDDRDEDSIAFSRAGINSPTGELTCEVKGKVDEETFFLFNKKMREAGTTRGAAVRDFVHLIAHGITYTDKCIKDAQEVKRAGMFKLGHSGAPAESLPAEPRE